MSDETTYPEQPDGPPEAPQQRGRAHRRLGATVEDRLGPATEHATAGGVALDLGDFRARAHAEATTSPNGRWRSIGPSVVENGQVEERTAREVSGRVDGIAYAPDSKKIYIATCNAGVWCRGEAPAAEEAPNKPVNLPEWVCLMDARPRRHKFDEDPEYLGSDSLACGAIAVAPTDENRIYVGSGEPFGAVDSYHGVGPIVSKNAGDSWTVEEVTSGSTPLKGRGFFGLAVDPLDEDRVVAATRAGIYARQQDGLWKQVQGGHEGRVVTSVLAVCPPNGQTTFFAAREGGPVYESSDGEAWEEAGTGFPGAVGRIELAAREGHPELIYALIAQSDGSLHGVLRVHKGANGWAGWQTISNAPEKLFGDPEQGNYQGWYDLAIAVDPDDENRIFLGGSGFFSGNKHKTSLYRCDITEDRPEDQGEPAVENPPLKMSPTWIGRSVHADIHALVFAGKGLWAGCDGGVFHAPEPGTANRAKLRKLFDSRNQGLSTMTMEGLGQHPTDPGKLYGGSQDNGGLYYDGNPERTWRMVAKGDAPGVVVNWAEPDKVLITKQHMRIRRSETGPDGGFDETANLVVPSENSQAEPEEHAIFYAPLVGTPYNPGHEKQAERVATGSYRVWASEDFGKTFSSLPVDCTNGEKLEPPEDDHNSRIRSLTFTDCDTLYVGTMAGRVYRYEYDHDKESATPKPGWKAPHRLDTDSELGLRFPVTCIAADPAAKDAIYITYGGPPGPEPKPGKVTADRVYRPRVWHYDGRTKWEARSGDTEKSTHLLDVHHSAIAVDPHPQDEHGRPTTSGDGKHWLYAGADIGVWRSKDEGANWEPCARGLPDAAVVDLKFHPSIGPNGTSVSDVKPVRLRASTHGRGVCEYCPVPIVTTIAGFEGASIEAASVSSDRSFDVKDVDSGSVYICNLALDPKGEILYLRSNHYVLKLQVAGPDAGQVTRVPGEYAASPSSGMRSLTGLAVDGVGNLYVADMGNHCVRKVSLDLTTTVVAGKSGTQGSYDPDDDGKPATDVALFLPQALGWDERNQFLYVTERDIVRRIDFKTEPPRITRFAGVPGGRYDDKGSGPATETGFYGPDAAVVTSDGKSVFIPDDFAIRRVTLREAEADVDFIDLVAGRPGESGYSGDRGPAGDSLLSSPHSLQLDEELGYLFVCCYESIRAIDLSTPTRTITTVAAAEGEPGATAWDKRRNILYVAQRYGTIIKVEGL